MSTLPERFRVPRGAPKRTKDFMEQYQIAWIRAVAAASGSFVWNVNIDDGVDVMLTHKHVNHQSMTDREARINVQLKATTSKPSGGYARAQMSRQRFSEFSILNPTISRVVVIMTMPQDPVHWLWASHRSLNLFGSSYWVNLAGDSHPGTGDVVVKAPTANMLDDVALARMMERVGKGGQP